jgi:Histidine kinase
MFLKKNSLKYTEILLLVFIWLVLLAAPILFKEDDIIEWRDIAIPMEIMIPLFVVFLFNRFLLVPKLLFRNKSLHYIISVASLIAIFTIGLHVISSKHDNMRPPMNADKEWRQAPSPNHGFPDSEILPPPNHGFPGNEIMLPPLNPGQRGPIAPFANFLIFSLLMVGFDTGLRVSFRLAESEQAKARLEKENLGTQLAFLRNQVSPHFFMNTLNNIHSQIDNNREEAKESIIRLSKLMRHLLYDSEADKITIQKEVEFIKNYVDLMKMRYSDSVKIELHLPEKWPDKSIPPLLYTSFVENAFKHGISYQNPSFVDIRFSYTSENFVFEIRNSNPAKEKEEINSGIGINNSRKRLGLIYGDNYELKIESNEKVYYVLLSIPL